MAGLIPDPFREESLVKCTTCGRRTIFNPMRGMKALIDVTACPHCGFPTLKILD